MLTRGWAAAPSTSGAKESFGEKGAGGSERGIQVLFVCLFKFQPVGAVSGSPAVTPLSEAHKGLAGTGNTLCLLCLLSMHPFLRCWHCGSRCPKPLSFLGPWLVLHGNAGRGEPPISPTVVPPLSIPVPSCPLPVFPGSLLGLEAAQTRGQEAKKQKLEQKLL